MSEFFNEKDYGDYFRRLEEELEKKQQQTSLDKALYTPAKENVFGAKSKRRRQSRINLKLFVPALLLAALILIGAIKVIAGAPHNNTETNSDIAAAPKSDVVKDKYTVIHAKSDKNTVDPGAEIESKYVIMIDTDSHKVIAERNSNERTSPASTTKIMTALVACEQITDFDDTFTMPLEITDFVYLEGATSAGFSNGEEITMTDLLYGCILPSGGDASLALAHKISGSEENFVKLMNKKAEELGLENTHFTNVTGLYAEDHYSSVADMAVILEAAMQNSFCRKVLSTYQYTTTATDKHPDGIVLTSTLFSYMYGTEPETATIQGGKTGYVSQSGHCIASFGSSESGGNYICVTFGAPSQWPSVYDQINMYTTFAK